jgi:hypothetical protein
MFNPQTMTARSTRDIKKCFLQWVQPDPKIDMSIFKQDPKLLDDLSGLMIKNNQVQNQLIGKQTLILNDT